MRYWMIIVITIAGFFSGIGELQFTPRLEIALPWVKAIYYDTGVWNFDTQHLYRGIGFALMVLSPIFFLYKYVKDETFYFAVVKIMGKLKIEHNLDYVIWWFIGIIYFYQVRNIFYHSALVVSQQDYSYEMLAALAISCAILGSYKGGIDG